MKRLIKQVLSKALSVPLIHLIPSRIISDITPEIAVEILDRHSPDSGKSALCSHVWPESEYDLSIIIPVYNVEKYLKKCLESILNQKTNYRYHIVVVNDGSTDNSENILKCYAGIENVTIIHQENGGFSKARNTGLSAVKGRYIMFVDSDDFLPKEAIDALISAAYQIEADIVQGSYLDTDETGEIFSGGTHFKKSSDVMRNGKLTGMAWGKVYRAHLFQYIHFPEGYWYEDTITTALVTHLAKNIATIPEIVYYYRQNSAGITRNSQGKPKSVDTYWVHRRVMQDRNKLGMVTDCAFYEHLLRMVALSYQRTKSEPKKVKIALMILWKDLLEKERRSAFVLSSQYKNFEKAILECDYNRYRLLCKFFY